LSGVGEGRPRGCHRQRKGHRRGTMERVDLAREGRDAVRLARRPWRRSAGSNANEHPWRPGL